MRIKVITVNPIDDKYYEIAFVSQYGEANSKWQGEPPIAGEEYEAELEIEDVFRSGFNIIGSDKKIYCIEKDRENLKINGKIELLEQDGIAVIRLGDSIFSIEFEGDIGEEGSYVTLMVKNFSLYNVNV